MTIIPAALRTPARILLLALLAALLLPGSAFADFLSPEDGGSPNADSIDTLYWIVQIMAFAILFGVWATLLYSMIKFRARRGAVPAQIRGNTRLEIGWTVGAALILVVLAVVTFVMLDDIRNAPESGANGVDLQRVGQPTGVPDTESVPPSGRSLRIQVNGQQYVWRYTYPDPEGEEDNQPFNNPFSYEEMVVPVDTTVTLELKAQDVIHSWWIPDLGGKMDGVPGHVNETWFKVSEPGVYEGVCAELCGENHADMRAEVLALPVDEYEAWAEQQRADIREAQTELAAQRQRREAAQQQQQGGEAAQGNQEAQ